MTIISFAQNFEDVMLWRALKHVENGFYIDVGANDPEMHSVTKAFYDRGWRGINIEPVQEWFERLESNRPEDINLKVAAGAAEGTITLYEVPETGLSTVKKDYSENAVKRGYKSVETKVQVLTLASICDQHVNSDIHFLKIDVEGAEKSVIDGMDFSRFRPWILLIESNLPNTLHKNYEEWEEVVLQAGYLSAYEDGLNNFYVAKEHSDLLDAFRYPPNVFDSFILWEQHRFSLISQQAEARAFEASARAEQALAQAAHANEHAAQAEQRAAEAEAQAFVTNKRIAEAEAHAFEANKRAQHAQMSAHNAEQQFLAIVNSRSWRMTAPLRFVFDMMKWVVRGGIAWITFKPGSRPRRTLKLIILHLRNWVMLRPNVKSRLQSLLGPFPQLKAWLRRLHHANPVRSQLSSLQNYPFSGTAPADLNALIVSLSPRAQRIYRILQSEPAMQEKGNG